ncbi:MAG: hypothetical protein AAFQ47_07555 [Pseudomonadota bacterium]
MFRLAMTLYSIVAPSLAGVGVIIVLVAGYGTLMPILVSAAIGALLGIPVAYLVAKAIYA